MRFIDEYRNPEKVQEYVRAIAGITSFGDMLRVPGSTKDLLGVKAEGGNVRIVYSPLDAVKATPFGSI